MEPAEDAAIMKVIREAWRDLKDTPYQLVTTPEHHAFQAGVLAGWQGRAEYEKATNESH